MKKNYYFCVPLVILIKIYEKYFKIIPSRNIFSLKLIYFRKENIFVSNCIYIYSENGLKRSEKYTLKDVRSTEINYFIIYWTIVAFFTKNRWDYSLNLHSTYWIVYKYHNNNNVKYYNMHPKFLEIILPIALFNTSFEHSCYYQLLSLKMEAR